MVRFKARKLAAHIQSTLSDMLTRRYVLIQKELDFDLTF